MTKTSNKIFVVDDDPFHLEMMQQILQSIGKEEIMLFRSGVDCLEAIHLNPSVVFLDHHMDVYSGYEILRKLKRHNPNVFVVMVSAQEEIQTAVNTLKHGAFDYLQKDIHLEENITAVLQRIEDVKKILRERKTFSFKSILKSF